MLGQEPPIQRHHGSTSPGSRHVPGQIHAAISTAKDKGFNPFRLRHGYVLSCVICLCLVESESQYILLQQID